MTLHAHNHCRFCGDKKHKNRKWNKRFVARFILVWISEIVWTLVWIVNYLHGSFLVNDFKRHAVFSVVCFCTRRKAMDNLLSTASISNKNQMILEFSALHLTNRRKRMAENSRIIWFLFEILAVEIWSSMAFLQVQKQTTENTACLLKSLTKNSKKSYLFRDSHWLHSINQNFLMLSDTVCNSEHVKYNKTIKMVVKCAENNFLCWASSEQSSTTKNIISFLSQMLNSSKLPEGCEQVSYGQFCKTKTWNSKSGKLLLRRQRTTLAVDRRYVCSTEAQQKRVFSAPMPSIFMGLVYCACSHLHSASENKSKFC